MDLQDTREGDSSQDQDGEAAVDDEMMFSCRLDSARTVASLLQCLSHGGRKDQHTQCEVRPEGLTFLVTGRAKFTQTMVALKAEMFQAYDCDEEGGKFGINLTTLLDCLQVFGVNSLHQTSLSMSYQPGQARFRLTLEEAGVFTSCEITTLHEEDDDLEFSALLTAFRSKPEACRCILKSEHLKEALQELVDVPGAASVQVAFSKTAPHFQVSAAGSMGTCSVEFPKTSEAFVLPPSCTLPRVTWTYQLSAMESAMRPLQYATETYFRGNADGIMCIQHQIKVPNTGQDCFVDCVICADVPDSDEEDDLAVEPANE